MIRLLVAVLLLHHIEGVCKPWSWITQAAAKAAQRLADGIAGRDTAEATQRAEAARTAATQRALDGRGRRAPLDAQRPADPTIIEGDVVDTMTRGLPSGNRPASVADQLRQHQGHQS